MEGLAGLGEDLAFLVCVGSHWRVMSREVT